jgi:hypothetical protein
VGQKKCTLRTLLIRLMNENCLILAIFFPFHICLNGKKPFHATATLKVHKIENFFGFDFEFYAVSLLVMLKYEGFVTKIFWIGPLWGEVGLFRVVLRLRGMKIFLNLGQKFFFV